MPKLRRIHPNNKIEGRNLRNVSGAAGTRRNPGRADGRTWHGNKFIHPKQVDGPRTDEYWMSDDVDEEWMGVWTEMTRELPREPSRTKVVEIMAIATPAKPRGVAKTFEVIATPSRVIALDDDEDDDWQPASDDSEWERWEDFSDDAEEVFKPTFARVVRFAC